MYSRYSLKQSVQTINNFYRPPSVRQFHGTFSPPGRPVALRIALPVAVGIISSSYALVAFAPLCRLDGTSTSNVKPPSGSRSKPAIWTGDDEQRWAREEVLQAFLDSRPNCKYDLLGLLAILLCVSYCEKPGRKLDRFETLIYFASQRLGQLRIKGLGYWGLGCDLEEVTAEQLAASERKCFEKSNLFGLVQKKDLPLISEDVKTALVGLMICRFIVFEFRESLDRAKKEGGPDSFEMKTPDIQEHVKSSEVMAHWGASEVLILCFTLFEAELVMRKPEIKAAFKKAGCDFESEVIQWEHTIGQAWLNTMLRTTVDDHNKYAAENIIKVQ